MRIILFSFCLLFLSRLVLWMTLKCVLLLLDALATGKEETITILLHSHYWTSRYNFKCKWLLIGPYKLRIESVKWRACKWDGYLIEMMVLNRCKFRHKHSICDDSQLLYVDIRWHDTWFSFGNILFWVNRSIADETKYQTRINLRTTAECSDFPKLKDFHRQSTY